MVIRNRTEQLLKRQSNGDVLLAGDHKTDLRKRVQQVARSCLPNETEAPIVVSANARALRHVVEMRASESADLDIRLPAFKMFLCMSLVDPFLFSDYEIKELKDGSYAVASPYRKV